MISNRHEPPANPCPARTHWAVLRDAPVSAAWFSRGSFNLNLLAIRSSAVDSDRYDDAVVVSYRDPKGVWCCEGFAATTDPGKRYREDPLNPAGTAVLCPQFAHLSHEIGMHRKRPALRQAGPLQIWRVAADAAIDFDAPPRIAGVGAAINIHDAPGSDDDDEIGSASAGCIVIPEGMSRVLDLVRAQHAAGLGPRVSLALVDTRHNPIASTLLAWARGAR